VQSDCAFGLQLYCSRVNCIQTAPELQFAVGLQLKCGTSVWKALLAGSKRNSFFIVYVCNVDRKVRVARSILSTLLSYLHIVQLVQLRVVTVVDLTVIEL
jgi:hypothetical protein